MLQFVVRFKHLFEFASLSLFISTNPANRFNTACSEREVRVVWCCRSMEMACCNPVLLILLLRKSHMPFKPLNTLNVFSGKGRVCHAAFNYSRTAVKSGAAAYHLSCRWRRQTDARVSSPGPIRRSRPALNFPLRLFSGLDSR